MKTNYVPRISVAGIQLVVKFTELSSTLIKEIKI